MARIMGVDTVTLASGSADLAVAAAVTIYTKSMRIKPGEYFALFYKFVSATGAPDVKIEVETGPVEPTTEGSADGNWVEPEDVSDIESSLITETMHHKAVKIPASPFVRFKITGNVANPADTIGNMYFVKQEE